jgi:hypothetical protein
MSKPAKGPNHSLQPTAAAILVWRSLLSLSAAAAAEHCRSAIYSFFLGIEKQ